jgi:hypothetical protein
MEAKFEQPPGRFYPFEVTSVLIDQVHRSVVRFHCVKCPKTIDLSVATTGTKMSPTVMVSRVKQKGWLANDRTPNHTLCPECQVNGRRHDPDEELKKYEARMTQRPKQNGHHSVEDGGTIHMPTPPPVVTIREPTTEARTQIRLLLEKNFDTDDGCYLDGFSDQKIAEQVNVPRIVVERAREFAFGPIRITPEIQTLRNEIAQARQRIEDVQSAASALIEQVGGDLRKLRAVVADLEGRVKSLRAA